MRIGRRLLVIAGVVVVLFGAASGGLAERDLAGFLAATDTAAFLAVRGDRLLYEGDVNGAAHDSVQASMSMANSVLSALVGMAIGEGRIGYLDDSITRSVPELAERDRRFAPSTCGSCDHDLGAVL